MVFGKGVRGGVLIHFFSLFFFSFCGFVLYTCFFVVGPLGNQGGNGPLCAARKFFESGSLLSTSFVVDRRRELFGSQHQQGWLLKV